MVRCNCHPDLDVCFPHRLGYLLRASRQCCARSVHEACNPPRQRVTRGCDVVHAGTLTPIVKNPDRAYMSDQVRPALVQRAVSLAAGSLRATGGSGAESSLGHRFLGSTLNEYSSSVER